MPFPLATNYSVLRPEFFELVAAEGRFYSINIYFQMQVLRDIFLFTNIFTLVSLLVLILNRPGLYAFGSLVLCLCGISLDFVSCWRRLFRYVWNDDVVSVDVSNERTNSRRKRFLKPSWVICSLIVGSQLIACIS